MSLLLRSHGSTSWRSKSRTSEMTGPWFDWHNEIPDIWWSLKLDAHVQYVTIVCQRMSISWHCSAEHGTTTRKHLQQGLPSRFMGFACLCARANEQPGYEEVHSCEILSTSKSTSENLWVQSQFSQILQSPATPGYSCSRSHVALPLWTLAGFLHCLASCYGGCLESGALPWWLLGIRYQVQLAISASWSIRIASCPPFAGDHSWSWPLQLSAQR